MLHDTYKQEREHGSEAEAPMLESEDTLLSWSKRIGTRFPKRCRDIPAQSDTTDSKTDTSAPKVVQVVGAKVQ